MLNQQTIEKLYAMRLRGMADAFTQQQEDPNTTQLSFEERFALLVDRQWNWRRIGRSSGGCERGDCKAPPASKTSTSARREDWTSRRSAPYSTTRTGCAATNMFS